MKILVTGSRGKVGSATVAALDEAGHDVTAVDLGPAVFERSSGPQYRQADLTFNVLEAAVRWGVGRFVNVSSETVPGIFFFEREVPRPYAPIDEDYPALPQDPYALAKHFGEQLMDAAVRRSDIRCISIRPSWVQWEGNYERNLGPHLRDPDEPSASFWSYIDVYDLADAMRLAAEGELPGHEVFYIVAPDTTFDMPTKELAAQFFPDVPITGDLGGNKSFFSSALRVSQGRTASPGL